MLLFVHHTFPSAFSTLSQNDQLQLIKNSFVPVWLVRIARMFNSRQWTLTFADGSYVTREQLGVVLQVR